MFRHSAKGEVFAQQLMLLYCGMDLFNDVEVWILCFNDAEEVRVWVEIA